jgi:NitT/TauT family transport system substrate-binding protein
LKKINEIIRRIKMKQITKTLFLIGFILNVILLTGCSNKSNKIVKIGYQPLASNVPFYVAMEKGFFTDEGLKVEPVRFESANTAVEALLNNQIATDVVIPLFVIFSIEQNNPDQFRLYAFQSDTKEHTHEAFIVRKDSKITSLKDFKGKKIGCFPGAAAQAYIKIMLKNVLNENEDITIVPMPPQLQLQALENKQIDVLLAYEPTLTIALEKGVAKVILKSSFAKLLRDPFPVTAFPFTKKYVDENPKIARKIVNAFYKSFDYIKKNPLEANKTIVKYTNLDEKYVGKLNQLLQQKLGEISKKQIQDFADWHYEIGLLKKKIDVSGIFYKGE